jgi:AraC-like DNA-binding protein
MLNRSGEDVLLAVLAAYEVRATLSENPQVCGNWKFQEPKTANAYFHLIDTGQCWLNASFMQAPVQLQAGDLIVLPHGTAHRLSAIRDRKTPPPPKESFTSLLCGDIVFTRGAYNPLLRALPELILVRGAEGGARFRGIAQLLSEESKAGEFGGRAVIDKLADALFVMAVRHYINAGGNGAQAPRGLVAALLDARLCKVLAAMHQEPGRDWTVSSLADVAGMSRTAFALRFGEVLEQSPIHYLTEWRMTQAEKLLRDPRQSVLAVAERLGYQTEAAFRRCFKRIHGYGPGQVRRVHGA